MNNIINFIAQHYEIVAGVAILIAALVIILRKRAYGLVINIFEEHKKDIIANIDTLTLPLADIIYSKLPVTARIFITKSAIQKIIAGITKEIASLDKSE